MTLAIPKRLINFQKNRGSPVTGIRYIFEVCSHTLTYTRMWVLRNGARRSRDSLSVTNEDLQPQFTRRHPRRRDSQTYENYTGRVCSKQYTRPEEEKKNDDKKKQNYNNNRLSRTRYDVVLLYVCYTRAFI